ncbi:MAG: diguanylate cyclase [Candidatus Kapaibacterium sp.]|nr:MAG: diguanylate cyclase [Candidatus Kapabacteria bacterium]
MAQESPNKGFSTLFNAPTDVPAFLVIALGIAIATFMEDLPVRLIGVCISILGSIALFVLYAQRVKDLSALQPTTTSKTTKAVSDVADFKTTVKKEVGSKRLVFDDFAESFGEIDDTPAPLSSAPVSTTPVGHSITENINKKKNKEKSPSLKKVSPQASQAQISQSTPSNITPTPSKQSFHEQRGIPTNTPAPTASNQALPKRLVFDDFDEAADFDDIQLVIAPEKFTSQPQQSVTRSANAAPAPMATDARQSSASSSTSGSLSEPPPTTFAKKILVFDDSDEGASMLNDFTPKVAIGEAYLPESLKKTPAPLPVTPAPQPFTRPLPTPENYAAPVLDTTLLNTDFDDDEGGEFRILGKMPSVEIGSSTANSAFQEEIKKKKSDEANDEAMKVEQRVEQNREQKIEQRAEQKIEQKVEQVSQQLSPQEAEMTTITEALQDKVTRASKAALHVATVEKEMQEISAVSAQVSSGRAERTADAVAAAQAADLKNYRPEKPDASKIAASEASHALPEEAVSHRRKKLTVTMDEIAEETPEVVKNEPRREFDFLLQRILMAIRSAMNARTAAYWWYAADRKQLTIEANISDLATAIEHRTIALSDADTLSQIALSGSPEILTEISSDAELMLLPYYTRAAGTRSFVGVPVFYNQVVVGILMADSTEDDAYDNATVSFLGHFTKLISGLIQSYTEKYDLLQAARTLEAIDTFRQLTLKPERTGEDICTALIRSLMRLVPYSTMGTCIYNDETALWYISNLHTKIAEARSVLGAKVVLESSLVGKTITNGRTYRFQNLTPNFVRLAEKELTPEMVAFTAIPLVSVSRCYGALFIEEYGETRLTKQDIEILETACEYAGTALEQIQLQDYVQNHAQRQTSSAKDASEPATTTNMDERTQQNIVEAIDFVMQIRQEMAKAKETGSTMSIALVKLDEYTAFANNDAVREQLFQLFSENVKAHIRENDHVGRYLGNIVGVCLNGKNTNEAQMWAERLRREIAGKPINIGGKQFTITASIGLAELLKQATTEELFTHAEQALQLASQATNRVNVFA